MTLDFSSIIKFLPLFGKGILVTIGLAISTIIIGILLGTPLSLMLLSKSKVLKRIAKVYVDIVRGTPLLLQLYIFAYALPLSFNISLTSIQAGIMALGLNSAAYVCEIIRSGIQAVDKGQLEASRALGLSKWKTMQKVILPQAIKNVLPTLGNEFVTIVKESSIVSIVGISDIMRISDQIRASTWRVFETLIFAAVLYFFITKTISLLINRFERRLHKNG